MAEEQVEEAPEVETTAPAEGLSLDDHRTYSQQIYGKPAWVLEGAFSHAKLDPNEKHTVDTVKAALEDLLGQSDKRYEGKQ